MDIDVIRTKLRSTKIEKLLLTYEVMKKKNDIEKNSYISDEKKKT